MTSWHDDLVPDMHALIVSFMDWRTGHLFARTDKANAALFARNKDRIFGPVTAVLSVPRGPLHPLTLLAHGYGVEDEDVAKHQWQWADIGDLAQFKETSIFIARLLHENQGVDAPPICASRTTISNMLQFRYNERWRAGFTGIKGFPEVIKAENMELLHYVFGRDRAALALADLLQWPDTDKAFFEEVLLHGSLAMFDRFRALRPLPPGFWEERLLRRIAKHVAIHGDYALFKYVRAQGFPLVAYLLPAIRSGDVAYLREAMAEPLAQIDCHIAFYEACKRASVDMIRIFIEEGGYEWPSIRNMWDENMLVVCINAGFDPFYYPGNRDSFREHLTGLLNTGKLGAFLAQITDLAMRTRIQEFGETFKLDD